MISSTPPLVKIMMTASNAFVKAEFQQQITQIIEGDVGAGHSAQYLIEDFVSS
jgi:hypothetical protein